MFNLFKKRWRLMVVALVAGVSLIAGMTPAFASQPGESSTWNKELANNTSIAGRGDTKAYSYNGIYHMTVWRGEDNSQVYLSINNGAPFTLGNTATAVPPTVVHYGQQGFAIFHVGIDEQVYWSTISNPGNPINSWSGSWVSTGGDMRTQLPVGVETVGPDRPDVALAWRGVSNNDVYTSRFTSGFQWSTPRDTGGISYSAPTLVRNVTSNSIFLLVRGTDNALWRARQPLNSDWVTLNWANLGGGIESPPAGAAASNGNMLVTGTAGGLPYYRELDQNGDPLGSQGWTADVTGWITNYPVVLVAVGVFILALMVGTDGDTIWGKQAANLG